VYVFENKDGGCHFRAGIALPGRKNHLPPRAAAAAAQQLPELDTNVWFVWHRMYLCLNIYRV